MNENKIVLILWSDKQCTIAVYNYICTFVVSKRKGMHKSNPRKRSKATQLKDSLPGCLQITKKHITMKSSDDLQFKKKARGL